jgi:hypothetical protein
VGKARRKACHLRFNRAVILLSSLSTDRSRPVAMALRKDNIRARHLCRLGDRRAPAARILAKLPTVHNLMVNRNIKHHHIHSNKATFVSSCADRFFWKTFREHD